MREWVTELSKALFSDETGLFIKTKGQHDFSYFPNSKAKLAHEALFLDYFRFAGQVLAKALFEKIPINVKLHPYLYQRLVHSLNN